MPLASFLLCQINIQNALAVYAPLALKCKYRGLLPQVVNYTSDSKTRCVILSAYRSLFHFTKLANKVKYLHLLGWPLFLGIKRIFRQHLMYLIQLQLTVSFFDTFTDNYGQEYLQCTFTVMLPVGPSPYSLYGVQLQFTGLLLSVTKVVYTSTAEVSKLVSSLQNR